MWTTFCWWSKWWWRRKCVLNGHCPDLILWLPLKLSNKRTCQNDASPVFRMCHIRLKYPNLVAKTWQTQNTKSNVCFEAEIVETLRHEAEPQVATPWNAWWVHLQSTEFCSHFDLNSNTSSDGIISTKCLPPDGCSTSEQLESLRWNEISSANVIGFLNMQTWPSKKAAKRYEWKPLNEKPIPENWKIM